MARPNPSRPLSKLVSSTLTIAAGVLALAAAAGAAERSALFVSGQASHPGPVIPGRTWTGAGQYASLNPALSKDLRSRLHLGKATLVFFPRDWIVDEGCFFQVPF